jgi:hypothetical protein
MASRMSDGPQGMVKEQPGEGWGEAGRVMACSGAWE